MLRPGDQDYDRSRQVWNAMFDRRPAMIVRCRTVQDVVGAVRDAREQGLEVSVRCGGHSAAGFGVTDGGLMIDLTPMGAASVDPARRRARVQGGALLGALDEAAQRHGLATTAGNVSHTGVGGLTLGGGMGWLARRYGLACDNVVSYQLVTADGDVRTVSADEHPELFWGLRGGGGNFGIVTEFEFALHDTGTEALVVECTFTGDRRREAMRRWRDEHLTAPRQATFTAATAPGTLTLGYVWTGPDTGYRPTFTNGGVERRMPMSYLQLQRRDDTDGRHALRRYGRSHYLKSMPDAAVDAFIAAGEHCGAGLQGYGGAIADVAEDATAFGHRDTMFEFGAGSSWTDPADDDARRDGARAAAALLEPFAGGVYVNSLGEEGAAGVRRAYPPAKLARLTALKDRYDPSNVFHLNQNITPTGDHS
ncbi:FAD-binding oxidoreductase [Dactylosporangium siamense]|uniref:FAD-linked oxidase n=1 Tax=Dactylosporangium siamense TaxID=685454 RepID=A0A919U8K6_9ACTN|nr:FAD-linked oxidase [Dactylosporangium siamense]